MANKIEKARPWDKLYNEEDIAWECFCIYKDLGYERSVKNVLDSIDYKDVTIQDIEKYKSDYSWTQRVTAWDTFLEKKIEVHLIKSQLKRRVKLSIILDTYITEFAARMSKGKIKSIDYSFDTLLKVAKISFDFDRVSFSSMLAATGMNVNEITDSAMAEIEENAKEIEGMTDEELKLETEEVLKNKLKEKYGNRLGVILQSKLTINNEKEKNGNSSS